MERGARIYNRLDETRKFMGFTALEILAACGFVFIGFAFNSVIFGITSCFASVFIIRYVLYLLQISRFKRFLFFFVADFMLQDSKINVFRRYYL